MTSPTSNSNPASPVSSPPGSPYNPLTTNPSLSGAHSLFASSTTGSGPSTSDGEQPCCSYTITASTSNTATASTSVAVTAVTGKRKRNCSSSSEGISEEAEPLHKKCKQKTHHLEPSTPTPPQQAERGLLRSFTMDIFALKKRLNQSFLLKFQRELARAMGSLEPIDITAAQVWDLITQSAPSSKKNEPIILFKRNRGSITRLNWPKLKRALSLLTVQTSQGPQRLGNAAAERATKWLLHFFQSLHSEGRPRHRMFGATFTRLCGQALAAQNAHIDTTTTTPLRAQEQRYGFLSTTDLGHALDHPDTDTTQNESAVVFIRHYDEPLNPENPLPGCQYPIKDFESGTHLPE